MEKLWDHPEPVWTEFYGSEGRYLAEHPSFNSPFQYLEVREEYRASDAKAFLISGMYGDFSVAYFGSSALYRDSSKTNELHWMTTGRLGTAKAYPPLEMSRHFSESICAISAGQHSFWHFLLESVPSLMVAGDQMLHVDGPIVLASGHAKGYPFAATILKRLFPGKEIAFVAPGEQAQFERSMAVSVFPFRVHPLLRYEMLARLLRAEDCVGADDHVQDTIVYLRRNDLARGRRRLINEEEIVDLLERHCDGFVVCDPEVDGLDGTLFKLQNAIMVLGMHGGALANLIFAPRLKYLVEFIPHGYPGKSEIGALARLVGAQYRGLPCEQSSDARWNLAHQQLNPLRLRHILNSLNLSHV